MNTSTNLKVLLTFALLLIMVSACGPEQPTSTPAAPPLPKELFTTAPTPLPKELMPDIPTPSSILPAAIYT